MTILGKVQAARPATKTEKPETLLGRARARADYPRGELVTMPLLGQVWVQLAGEEVVTEIESAVFAAMEKLKLQPNAFNASTYDSRRGALTLAWAVRHPDQDRREERAGTEQEWVGMDIDLLSACGLIYQDVRERLNPLGDETLDSETFEAIRFAHEKKNARLLRTYGVASLSIYLATTDVPPASSPLPPSSDGPSSPATS